MRRSIFAALVPAALALAGCGGGGGGGGPAAPSQVVLHGTVSEAGVCGRFIPPSLAGTAVIDIVSPSGAELAQVKVNQLTASQHARCRIPFTVTKLPPERLYGVRVEGDSGTVWVHRGQAVVVNGTL
jgi:hypothetical protein